jgi:hypothetical protein
MKENKHLRSLGVRKNPKIEVTPKMRVFAAWSEQLLGVVFRQSGARLTLRFWRALPCILDNGGSPKIHFPGLRRV